MSLIYKNIDFYNLDKDELNRLTYLAYPFGYFRTHLLPNLETKRKNLIGIYVWDEDKIIGWGTYERNNDYCYSPDAAMDKYLMAVYVDRKYRNKGIGSEIVRLLKKRAHRKDMLICLPTGPSSERMYSKFNIPCY